jgi:hypothetical protein
MLYGVFDLDEVVSEHRRGYLLFLGVKKGAGDGGFLVVFFFAGHVCPDADERNC